MTFTQELPQDIKSEIVNIPGGIGDDDNPFLQSKLSKPSKLNFFVKDFQHTTNNRRIPGLLICPSDP